MSFEKDDLIRTHEHLSGLVTDLLARRIGASDRRQHTLGRIIGKAMEDVFIVQHADGEMSFYRDVELHKVGKNPLVESVLEDQLDDSARV